MSINTVIPTTIEAKATEFAANLGLERPLAEILDHLKQTVSDLQCVTVEYAPAYDSGEDGILIHACRDAPHSANRQYWEAFSAWKTAHFSAEVWRRFNLILSSENKHGG